MNFLKDLRWWWDANNSEQRAGALRMYVGPTIETGKGVKDIRAVAEVSFDDLDDTVLSILAAHHDSTPNFLD